MKKKLATAMAATMLVGSVTPAMAATITSNEEIIGKNRTETAVKISQDGWKKAETVILVNDSAIPDALTATPLAHAKNAPILLTGKDGLTKATADEIKRLGAKDVIMIGGDAVLTSKVEEDLKALELKVDRIKGASREETALEIAKRLDGIKDVSEIAVVNGITGLADAVSVAAAAAEKGMPILLANPKSGLTLVEKFIKDEAIKSSFIIGGDKAVSNEIAKNLPGKQRIEGANRKETNAKVIETFYTDRELDNLYLAKDGIENSGHLIDALAVGALAAKNGAPVLIASKKLNEKQINVINTKKITTITQVGGNGNEKAFDELKEIEKSEVIKVKNEAELQEALKKADANDVIEIESSASISKDVTLSTNNAVEINVKGDLKGEVTVKAPNADIKNSGTIGTLVVEDGKNTTIENASGGKIDKVEVDSSSENVKVENKGTITQVENNAAGTTIDNKGTISKPVTGTEKPSVDGNKPGGTTSGGGGSSIDQGKVAIVDKAKDAAKYEYKENPYTYTGEIRVSGTESANVVIAGPYKNEELSLKNAMNDMARYLGALHRVDSGATISAIKYNGKEYTWNLNSKNNGSNWVEKDADIKNSLVSAIVSDLKGMSLEDMSKKSLNLTLVGKNEKEVSMSMTLKQEFPVEANGVGYATLQEAINANGTVKLLKDVTVSEELKLNSSGKTVIDLNGKTLKSTSTNDDPKVKKKSFEPIESGKSLTIKKGNLYTTSTGASVSCIKVNAGGSITLDEVNYTTEGTGIFASGKAASVNVKNGSVMNAKGFCVSTNAETEKNHNVEIKLENSKFEANEKGTPVLVNVPCKLDINKCTIIGSYQGVIVRGGTATITDTDIINNVKEYEETYLENWNQGNMIPQAALLIGNRPTTAYQYASNVTLNNCTITQNGHEKVPAIYIWGNSGKNNDGKDDDGVDITATLNYNGKEVNRKTLKGPYCTINGNLSNIEDIKVTN